MDRQCGLLKRLLLDDWMPLTHGLSEKSSGSHIGLGLLDTLPAFLSGRLPTGLQFQVSLKQEDSASLATWHVQIPGKIITELSVNRSDHHESGDDLEGARVPPDADIQSANISIHSAWRKVNDRVLW